MNASPTRDLQAFIKGFTVHESEWVGVLVQMGIRGELTYG